MNRFTTNGFGEYLRGACHKSVTPCGLTTVSVVGSGITDIDLTPGFRDTPTLASFHVGIGLFVHRFAFFETRLWGKS